MLSHIDGIIFNHSTWQPDDCIKKLYKLFIDMDSTQVEINPFAVTPGGEVVCFDAKIGFDENASFRQKDIFAIADTAEDVSAAPDRLRLVPRRRTCSVQTPRAAGGVCGGILPPALLASACGVHSLFCAA